MTKLIPWLSRSVGTLSDIMTDSRCLVTVCQDAHHSANTIISS